jgi:hypothetical protein
VGSGLFFLSAFDPPAGDAGFDCYLPKPIRQLDLEAAIESLIQPRVGHSAESDQSVLLDLNTFCGGDET